MIRKLRKISLREQYVWASLAVTLGVYGWYLYSAWTGPAGRNPGMALGLLIQAVVIQVILSIGMAIALAIFTPEEPKDERDLRIELLAYRLGYLTLVCCVMLAVPLAFLGAVVAEAGVKGPLPVLVGHSLFLSLVASEVVTGLTQVFLYRRGA